MFVVDFVYQLSVEQEVASGADKVFLVQLAFDDTEPFQYDFLAFGQHDDGVVAVGAHVDHFVLAGIESAVEGAEGGFVRLRFGCDCALDGGVEDGAVASRCSIR